MRMMYYSASDTGILGKKGKMYAMLSIQLIMASTGVDNSLFINILCYFGRGGGWGVEPDAPPCRSL